MTRYNLLQDHTHPLCQQLSCASLVDSTTVNSPVCPSRFRLYMRCQKPSPMTFCSTPHNQMTVATSYSCPPTQKRLSSHKPLRLRCHSGALPHRDLRRSHHHAARSVRPWITECTILDDPLHKYLRTSTRPPRRQSPEGASVGRRHHANRKSSEGNPGFFKHTEHGVIQRLHAPLLEAVARSKPKRRSHTIVRGNLVHLRFGPLSTRETRPGEYLPAS